MEKKIYKLDSLGNWGNFSKVEFPDGQVMDENNHDKPRDGFFWSENPPKDYLEWKKEQENEQLQF